MGRVARYKKVKSIDPFAKNGSWRSDVGDCSTLHRVKRRSKTALKMKARKMNKSKRRARGERADDVAIGGRGGGSNGYGDDDGYDLPPEGGDEFDMNDLMGSVKRQGHDKPNLLLGDDNGAAQLSTSASSTPSRFVGVPSSIGNMTSKGSVINNKANTKKNDSATTLIVTAQTPTRDIIAACSNPTPTTKKNKRQIDDDSYTGMSKQEKRKAYFEKKRLKKRKRASAGDDDEDDDVYIANRNAETKFAAKKHPAKQQNYSDTVIARTAAFDVQAERPPTFTMLPRGAHKLAKKNRDGGVDTTSTGKEGVDQRIRKEKQSMEAMRERVMKQYAILRESRRNGG
ncbi:hypothetical protein ACHAXA_003703 [Cyclostephanos tholiformis]|uniref:Uncharacterized protein n=1 Tax=Cyclostephanos tholiformis TaxID=382380 RepID=A0ABD3RZ73_9STRA